MKHYNIPIFIPHLGCPYDCIYCDQKKIAAQSEIPEPYQITQMIEQYLKTISAEAHVEVAFFGGNFTAVDKQQQVDYLKAVQPFMQQGQVQSIRVSTRPDCIDESVLDLLSHYGVKMIELGVQSLSDKVLQASSRNYKPEDVYKSSHLIKDWQFDLGIQLMVGLPQDTYKQDIETTYQAISLRPQAVRIYPTLVISGTALESLWERGDYIPLSLDEAVATCSDMLLLFQKENIRVIRMGLYPGEELRREGVIKAGPFHSSFGELVEQEIFRDQARAVIRRYMYKFGSISDINLLVNYRDISKMVGKQKSNLDKLKDEFNLASIKVKVDESLPRDCIGINDTQIDTIQTLITRTDFLDSVIG